MKSLPASPPLARALAERNYHDATPVQTAVLAPEAIGRDLENARKATLLAADIQKVKKPAPPKAK